VNLVGFLTYCGTWLLGVGVGYVAARRAGRAEAAECVSAWQRAHAAALAHVDELRCELARARRTEGGTLYEELVRRDGQ
jgi:hypothetical protein